MNQEDPPFDGKPCPACPIAIRGLYATAFNFCNVLEGKSTTSSDTSLDDLKAALAAAAPLIDAHFADRRHSHR